MIVSDFHLWEFVKTSITRLGQPRKPQRVFDPIVRQSPKKIDLHGVAVNDAYVLIQETINNTKENKLLVITGASGIIKKEFPDWFSKNTNIKKIKEVNNGSFVVEIK